MKLLLFLIVLLLGGITVFAKGSDSTSSAAKDTLVTDVLSQRPMLLGIANREALQDTNFSWWFNSLYDTYDVDSSSVSQIEDLMKNINITVVMGTWCSDSRREVPRLFRILDMMKYPSSKVKMIMVGRDRKGLHGETDGLDIELVPTIIFYRDGKEIGRIVESPKETLEKDMVKIIKG